MTIHPKYQGRSVFTVPEVAEILCCTSQHVRNLIADRKLVAMSIGRSQNEWRIEAADLVRYMKAQSDKVNA